MSNMTRAEEAILAKMSSLNPSEPRYRVLEATLTFKASWIILAEHLTQVASEKLFKTWGFRSFEQYCNNELHVGPSTAKKLIRSYSWIRDEAPEYAEYAHASDASDDASDVEIIDADPKPRLPPPVPDYRVIDVLTRAKEEYMAERCDEEAYQELKRAAFSGEKSVTELKKSLDEAIPEEKKPQKPIDRVQQLRKALLAAVKAVEALAPIENEEGLGEIVQSAAALRDVLAKALPGTASETF